MHKRAFRTILAAVAVILSGTIAHAAATAVQWGANRGGSPWQICVFDSTNTCQPVFLLPPTGGGAYVPPANGGTGINNGSYTITLGGSVATGGAFTLSGAYPFTATLTGATNITMPTSGTLVAAPVPNSQLQNPSTTVNGQTCTLGSSCTVTAAATSIAPGVTAITPGGTPGDIEYNNGGLLGELPTTGSGSVVLNTSPTLVAPTLGTPSSGNGTNITNVNAAQLLGQTWAIPASIGATTPNAGAFSSLKDTALAVAGLVTNTSAGILGTTPIGTGVATALGSATNAANGVAVPTNAPAADEFLMFGTSLVYASIPNCATALTYSTSTHLLGCSAGAGTGTVTSVGLAMPGMFTVSGSPVTTTGTLTAALATQTANTALRGPASGAAAAPTFRAPVAADLAPGLPGGFLNLFRNATFDVWARGTSLTATTAGAYTVDGWWVQPTGASVAVAQVSDAPLTANPLSFYALKVTGATSVSDIVVKHPIESLIATKVTGQTFTVQFRFDNQSNVSVTPKLTTRYPSAQDNYASNTVDISAVSFQACAAATVCVESLTEPASSSATNGYEVDIDFGNNWASGSNFFEISELDFRLTPGVATGLNSAPPPPEMRPAAYTVNESLRYLQMYLSNGTTATVGPVSNGFAISTTLFVFRGILPVPMRATPSMTSSGLEVTGAGGPLTGTAALSADTTSVNFGLNMTVTVATAGSPAVLIGSTSSAFLALSSEIAP